ncbi:MAG: ATP-dependent DNA helicase [Propionibacteriaceae bacterium]|nr:ATP-dependent DNA helicase [Propionibacteriaceae bacterium]
MDLRVVPPRRIQLPALSAEQAALAEPHSGVRVVYGGPGSGKTTLVAEAAAARVAAGSSLDRLIVLAHSRAAAQSLRRSITRRLTQAQTGANITTIHGLSLGLLRRYWPHQDSPWRLLRAPEQEVRIRELLEGKGPQAWPEEYRGAVGTRAFARQLREVLARARQLSLDPDAIEAMAGAAGDELFRSAARFIEEYLTVADYDGSLDYAELVYRTRLLLTEAEVASGVLASFDAVLVDDAHESDHAQVGLVADLARLGLPVLTVGDPHSRIGGYRGASPTAMADLASLPGASVAHLGAGFRNRSVVQDAMGALRARLDQRHASGALAAVAQGGSVTATVYDDDSAELAHVAAQLRDAVTEDELAWSDLVVITRAGRAQLSAVAKELVRLGVPVDVSGDEIALAEQPAVSVVLLALQVCARGGAPEADEARLLLSSPLCGLDGVGQRSLGRALLARHRSEGTSAVLLGRCLGEPELLADLEGSEAAQARSLAQLLAQGAALVAGNAEVQQVLWALWAGTPWPDELREQALRGSRRADADLDAMVELFEQAARADDLRGAAGAATFAADVAGQEIPADTGRELDISGRGVRVVTAHRTRGLEWERAWVVGVQEGLWPRLTRAGILVDADRLGPGGLAEPGQSSHLTSERQLFHVACSRARSALHVSAVQGVDGEGGRPSRFLGELGVTVQRVVGRPQRLLSAAALVGDLRRVVADEAASPGLRRAAALRLATMASVQSADGNSAFPGASPTNWWGNRAPSSAAIEQSGPFTLNGSSLAQLLSCPRMWFLSRKAQADPVRQSRASVGDVVHLVASQGATEKLSVTEMHERLDQVWAKIPFETEWLSATERTEIFSAVERFANYQEATPNELLAVEVPFVVTLSVAGAEVTLRGAVDRLERTPDGRLRVVDLKTGRRVQRAADVLDNPQLGVYQLAASLGAFADVADGATAVAPPALLFLRAGDSQPEEVEQPSIDDVPRLAKEELSVGPTWVHDRIAQAVQILQGGTFEAVECSACRYCPFADSCPALSTSGARR